MVVVVVVEVAVVEAAAEGCCPHIRRVESCRVARKKRENRGEGKSGPTPDLQEE